MSVRSFPRHLGVAAALSAIAFAVVVPTTVVPLAEHRAGVAAEDAAMRAVRQVDAALERGERADDATDRIGAVTGHRIRVLSRNDAVIGDTGRDGGQLANPVPADVARFVDEIRARGAVTKKLRLGGLTVAAERASRPLCEWATMLTLGAPVVRRTSSTNAAKVGAV